MLQFATKHPDEKPTLTFDFTRDLPTGVTLAASPAPSVDVAVFDGTDASPSDVKDGSPQVASPNLLQGSKGGVSGVTYLVTAKAYDSNGKPWVIQALLPVRSYP